VDPTRFHPGVNGNEIREKLGCTEESHLILCPRRIVPKNGVIYMVKAMSQVRASHPEAKLLVVGGGWHDEIMRVREQIGLDGLTSSVIIGGAIPNDQMSKYYTASDLVVLPSLKEATSLAGLEGMASSKPLVGTEVGGIPYIVDNSVTGLLVPSRDSQALARAVIELLDDPKRRLRMGDRARERVLERFSWDIIADQTYEVYKKNLR
jgi:glycosyltransferase involved in cell wall biosynthesis